MDNINALSLQHENHKFNQQWKKQNWRTMQVLEKIGLLNDLYPSKLNVSIKPDFFYDSDSTSNLPLLLLIGRFLFSFIL